MDKELSAIKKHEERQLVARALAGEELAWKQIQVRYKKIMKKAIKSHLNKFGGAYDGEIAYDVYQEVLLKLHKGSLNSFEGKSSLGSFLFVVSLNTAKDYAKSKLGQSNLQEINPETGDEDGPQLVDLVGADPVLTIDRLLDAEERHVLSQEISSLKEDKKKILELYLNGEKNKDIAKDVKRTESYVNKCIFNFKNYMTKKYKAVA
jgi:RNA polymerase sigma factor (sigma-70 family)